MYLIKMTDENGDVFYKNHAYRITWGSWDMAQTYDNRKEALYDMESMPSWNTECVTELEEF